MLHGALGFWVLLAPWFLVLPFPGYFVGSFCWGLLTEGLRERGQALGFVGLAFCQEDRLCLSE